MGRSSSPPHIVQGPTVHSNSPSYLTQSELAVNPLIRKCYSLSEDSWKANAFYFKSKHINAHSFIILLIWGHPCPLLWDLTQLSCKDHTSTHHLQLPICIYVKWNQEPKTVRIPSRVFQDFPHSYQFSCLHQILLSFIIFFNFSKFFGDLPFWVFSNPQ